MADCGKNLTVSTSSAQDSLADNILNPHSVQVPETIFEERVSGPYETIMVRRSGNKERRKTLSNFVLIFKNVIKGSKAHKCAVSGWWVELLATTFAETTSLLIPATALNTDKELLRFLQLNTEAGALLTLSATNDTMRAFVAWKQAKFVEADPQNRLVREYVLNLGIQPDGITLIMGKNSRGIFERDQDGAFTLQPISESDCKYLWSDAVGLADFNTNLFTNGGNMVQLLKSVFSERYELNFYSLLGYETLPFFEDYVRMELKCPTPVPVLTGPTGSGKTRKFEYVGAIVGYDQSNECAWDNINFVNASIAGVEGALKTHRFPLMISDAKNMAVLESVTKQVFDHAGKVNNRGIQGAATGLILGCNPEMLEKYLEKIDPSTRERHVILEQKPLLREMTDTEKIALGEAREQFSGYLAKIANPEAKSKFLRNLSSAYSTLKSDFLQILLKKGVEGQATRLSETYALVLALGSAMYGCLNENGFPQIVGKYLAYFKESLCDMIMAHQVRRSAITDAELPELLCQALVQFMKINSKWHCSLHWTITSKELDYATCIGMRTSEIFSTLEESTDPNIKNLLNDINISKVSGWLRAKEGGKKRAAKGSINGLCHGTSMFGDIVPVRHLESYWKIVLEEAKQQNHEPELLRCGYHARKAAKIAEVSQVPLSPVVTVAQPSGTEPPILITTRLGTDMEIQNINGFVDGALDRWGSDVTLADPGPEMQIAEGSSGDTTESHAVPATNPTLPSSQLVSAEQSSNSGQVSDFTNKRKKGLNFTMEFPRELDDAMVGSPSFADDLEKTRESLGISASDDTSKIANNTRSKRTNMDKAERVMTAPFRAKAAKRAVAIIKVCAVCGLNKAETAQRAGRFKKCGTCSKWMHVKCQKADSTCCSVCA